MRKHIRQKDPQKPTRMWSDGGREKKRNESRRFKAYKRDKDGKRRDVDNEAGDCGCNEGEIHR